MKQSDRLSLSKPVNWYKIPREGQRPSAVIVAHPADSLLQSTIPVQQIMPVRWRAKGKHVDIDQVRQLLIEAFAPIPGTDADFAVTGGGDELGVVTPDWSFQLVHWNARPVARVLLTNRPSGLDASRSREAVMSYEIDEAFADVDRRTDFRLSAALRASQDPVSLSLMGAMQEIESRLAGID